MSMRVSVIIDDDDIQRAFLKVRNENDLEDVETLIHDLIDEDAPMLPKELRKKALESVNEIAADYRYAMDNDDHWSYVLEEVIRMWVRREMEDGQ